MTPWRLPGGVDPTQRRPRARRPLLGARLTLVTVTAAFVAGCSSPGGASNTPAFGSAGPVTVTSTLAGQSILPLRVYWEAMPSVPATQIFEVDFLIDGKQWWGLRDPPYVYGNAGNWLVTSSLMPGKHSFTVGVLTLSDQVTYAAVNTVIATVVAPPAPPNGLAGTWARTVTAANIKKATSDPPLPLSGPWLLTIDPAGWGLVDPHQNYRRFDVAYQPSATLDMRPTIETLPPLHGEFCSTTDFAYVDPIWSWSWTAAIGGGVKTLTLHPQGLDPCGNRAAVLEGRWTLVNPP
jgi:hypothetical protein